MAKVKTVTILGFTLPDKVGQLAAVTSLLGDAGVNLAAIRAAGAGPNAEFLVAVKKTGKAKKALAELGVDLKESEALCIEIPNRAGRLHKAAKKLAEAGVDIRWVWGTAFTGKTAGCIVSTSDDRAAIAALKA
jgi:hypothetical protein